MVDDGVAAQGLIVASEKARARMQGRSDDGQGDEGGACEEDETAWSRGGSRRASRRCRRPRIDACASSTGRGGCASRSCAGVSLRLRRSSFEDAPSRAVGFAGFFHAVKHTGARALSGSSERSSIKTKPRAAQVNRVPNLGKREESLRFGDADRGAIAGLCRERVERALQQTVRFSSQSRGFAGCRTRST